MTLAPWIAAAALVVVAAFVAVAEAAIGRISRVKAHHLAQEKRTRSAERLEAIVEDRAPFMSVITLLIMSARVSAVVIATLLARDMFGASGGVIAVLVMIAVLFVLTAAVPRSYVLQHPDRAALLTARPTFVLGRVLAPLAQLLVLVGNAAMVVLPGRRLAQGPFVTEGEIRQLVDVAEEEQEIEEGERELIHSVFEFGDTIVREVMVPRPDMVTVPAEAAVSEALATITKAGYSRVPIIDGDSDNIIGVLYAKDLLKRIHDLKRDAKIRSLGRGPMFVPEQKRVSELLREMQQQRIHIAIVVDEYGGTAGLVTIEDLLEEIVGEIVDEYDREEPLVEPINDSTIRVDAKMPIDEVNELLETDLPHDEWDTVGGLVFNLTGRVPEPGEKVRYDSIEFTTERVAGRRIQKVVITKLAQAEPAVE